MQLNHLLDTSHKTDYSTYIIIYYIGVENNNHVDMKSTSVNYTLSPEYVIFSFNYGTPSETIPHKYSCLRREASLTQLYLDYLCLPKCASHIMHFTAILLSFLQRYWANLLQTRPKAQSAEFVQ